MKLLSRDEFREAVFERDGHTCVVCGNPAQDAHHILERRLFPDSGYYLDNGASVCGPCHLKCESTEISAQSLRDRIGITRVVLPEHLYDDLEYDKWGNPIMSNGTRLRGELFHDESVQKVIKPYLNLFTNRVKYPRTHHLPWSNGQTEDDRTLRDLSNFDGQRVIVTSKMDGENTSWYSDYFHARSIDGRHHESRNWVKNFWSSIKHEIPTDWIIRGENLFAEHSIRYENLESYFMGFQIWNDRGMILSWDDTIEWFKLLGITSVPVLYDGLYDSVKIRSLWDESKRDHMEGYVVRVAREFHHSEFRKVVGKVVRSNHVNADSHHWFSKQVVPNRLKSV